MKLPDEAMTIGDELNQEEMPIENVEVVEQSQQGGGLFASLPDILKAKTGPGSVEEYIEHPLNFSKNMGLARIIRGATGILGALDLAIIDIGLGLLEFLKGRKKVDAPATE